jgi:hypothetical protein
MGMSFVEMRAQGGPSPNTLARYANWKIGDETWDVKSGTYPALDAVLGGKGRAAELMGRPEVDPGVVVTDVDEFATVLAERVCAMLAARLGSPLMSADSA